MHLKYRNVNDAFVGLVGGFHDGSIPTVVRPSRYGEVALVEEPVIITYDKPRERVLFNQARDCNPFFHLYESLWMLAGRNDVAPLVYYNSKMAEFSDDEKTFNGAYGYRWRQHSLTRDWEFPDENINQLEILIDHLREKPESRRAVLQMWSVEDDLLKIDDSKDVCCNTCVYFSIELGDCDRCKDSENGPGNSRTLGHPHGPQAFLACSKCKGKPHEVPRYLNMTVCNRSNDLIWGMLGANVVHFSFLQEYVACALGLEVGTYNQMSNNLHVYTERWEPVKWLDETKMRNMHSPELVEYQPEWNSIPLFDCAVAEFDRDCRGFVSGNVSGEEVTQETIWNNQFLDHVAQPMMHAFHMHKQRHYQAVEHWMAKVMMPDWRIAGRNWIEKRRLIWEKKN